MLLSYDTESYFQSEYNYLNKYHLFFRDGVF